MGLIEYLKVEDDARRESLDVFRPELDMMTELADFYTRLLRAIEVSRIEALIAAELCLVAENQLHGSVSQLLRRRVGDSWALNRKAIEAAGVARRATESKELVQVFVSAYPNVKSEGAPTQFQPSDAYWKAFKTKKILRGDSAPWPYLRSMYSVLSTMAVHGGLGATSGHRRLPNQVFANFLETDARELLRAWYSAATIYKAVWEVFFGLLRSGGKADQMTQLGIDVATFWRRVRDIANKRVPWIRALDLATK